MHPAANSTATEALLGRRVLIIDDHQLVAQSIVLLLRSLGIAAECVLAASLTELEDAAREFTPDVVLLDFDLGPLGTSLPLVATLADLPAIVVLFTAIEDELTVATAVEAGAAGVLRKCEPPEKLIDAISTALATGTVLTDPERQDLLAALRDERRRRKEALKPFTTLTRREREVLVALEDGLTAAEIAEEHYVSVFTVRGHIRSILAKLGVSSQLQAAALARRVDWADAPISQS